MKQRDLEVTYRRGEPFAAYFYLQRLGGDTASRTERFGRSLLLDFSADGRPIGIEIISPRSLSLSELNEALESVGEPLALADEVGPVVQAA